MEIWKLLENSKKFNYGLCITECRVYQVNNSDPSSILTLRKGCLVKIFEYKPNHVVLTKITNANEYTLNLPNNMLLTPNHTYFKIIELHLYNILIEINDIEKRLEFYQNIERREFVRENYKLSKNSHLANKYKALQLNRTNVLPNTNTSLPKNERFNENLNARLIDSNDLNRTNHPLKTFIMPPVKQNKPNGNGMNDYLYDNQHKSRDVLQAPGIRIYETSSSKLTINKCLEVPDINPKVKDFVIDSKRALRNYVPAVILNKINMKLYNENTCRKFNYKTYQLPRVEYAENTDEEISEFSSNVAVTNDVPDAILRKQNNQSRIDNLSAIGNYKPFVLPRVHDNEETNEEILSKDVSTVSSLQGSYKPFKLATDRQEEILPKNTFIDLKDIPSTKVAQKGIDANKLKPNMILSNHNSISQCLMCRDTSGDLIELDCLHVFCQPCLISSFSDLNEMYCPFKRGKYKCAYKLDDDNLKNIITMQNKLF